MVLGCSALKLSILGYNFKNKSFETTYITVVYGHLKFGIKYTAGSQIEFNSTKTHILNTISLTHTYIFSS